MKLSSSAAGSKPLVNFMNKTPVKRRSLVASVFIAALCCVNAGHACEQLQFQQAWVREPPPVSKVAAAYVAITNPTNQAVTITGIQSDCCQHLMIHETVVEDGRARMVHQDALIIAPNSAVELAPLGTHIMLMGSKTAIRAGAELTIHFGCDTNNQTAVSFPFKKK